MLAPSHLHKWGRKDRLRLTVETKAVTFTTKPQSGNGVMTVP